MGGHTIAGRRVDVGRLPDHQPIVTTARTTTPRLPVKRINHMTDLRDSPDWIEDCNRWHGKILTGVLSHWCWDWDVLPIDETTDEIMACSCDVSELIRARVK